MPNRRRTQEYSYTLHLPPTEEGLERIKQKIADAYVHEVDRRLKNCELNYEQKLEVLDGLLKIYQVHCSS